MLNFLSPLDPSAEPKLFLKCSNLSTWCLQVSSKKRNTAACEDRSWVVSISNKCTYIIKSQFEVFMHTGCSAHSQFTRASLFPPIFDALVPRLLLQKWEGSASCMCPSVPYSMVQSSCSILTHFKIHRCLISNNSLENGDRKPWHLSTTVGAVKTLQL